MNNIDESIIPKEKEKKKTNVVDMPTDGWKKQLHERENGGFKRNSHNVITILSKDPQLKGIYAYDSFKNEAIILKKPPWDDDFQGPRRVQDMDDACLRNYFDLHYGIRSKELIDDCLQQVLRTNSFHPIRSYLNSIEWDGERRLEQLFVRYLGAEDSNYCRTVTRKAFVAAVARVMSPGCKYDTILTLVGPQGAGKSTIFRLMGKEWFLDSLQNTNDKDALQTIQGSWIVEIAELSALRKSEIEAFKNYTTSTVDKYRPSYGKRIVERPRQCVFVGTTNEDTFLRDATGNRRFWPLRVRRKMTPKEIEEFAGIVDQLWAEAKHYFEQGETLYLSTEQEDEANATREQFIDEDPRKGLIEEFLNIKLPENWKRKSIDERRDYIQEQSGSRNRTGEELRRRISAVEIYCELFAEPRGKFMSAKGREIKNILKSLNGWKFIGQQRVSDEYGKQETFERVDANRSTSFITQEKEYPL